MRRIKRFKHSPRRNVSGKRIRLARLMRKPPVSQYELVRNVNRLGFDLDQSIISRIENQDRSINDLELIAIARCLEVSVAWLCGESKKII